MKNFLDLREFPCPQPVFKARQQLKTMQAEDILTLWCKTQAAVDDFTSFCRLTHHTLVEVTAIEDYYQIKIQVKS